MNKSKTFKPVKAWAVLWDKCDGLTEDNIDAIVFTRYEAIVRTDISNDEDAQENTPHYGAIPVLISPLPPKKPLAKSRRAKRTTKK